MESSEQRPPDYLGIASLVCGLLATAGCMGMCIPYLNSLFMMFSMMLSLVGTILGVLAVMDRRKKAESEAMAIAGLAISAIILLLWILYWIFIFLAVFLMMGGLVALIVAENL
ncbi:MAG: hypothetical protein H6737_15930 [Alphaproteobacteria bacterium]|nr:hypothetical protein [Alphaproteobacteria bacterium]